MPRVDQKILRIVHSLSIAAFLGLASCLQMEQTVTLSADGSGKLTFAMTMRDATIAEVRRASAAAQLGGVADPTAVFDKAKAELELTDAGLGRELSGPENRPQAQGGAHGDVSQLCGVAEEPTCRQTWCDG